MRADRLLSLLLILQERKMVKARELAERLNVSERTIYRDMDVLSGAGVPVYAEPGPSGGFALLEDYRTNLTGLNEAEVQALAIFNVPETLTDIGLSRSLETGLLKLAAAVPPLHQLAAERIQQRLYIDTSPWFHRREAVPHLERLREAVWQDRHVSFRYSKPNGTQKEVPARPYALAAKDGLWYLVAETDDGMRVYRVSRITDLAISGTSFQRRPAFELASFWEDWCRSFEKSRPRYPVIVRLAPGAIDLLPDFMQEYMRHMMADADPEPNGWRRVTLDFEREHLALTQAMSLGRMMEVLEPVELRQRVAAVAAELTALYARSNS